MHEAQLHEFKCFITLTYDDRHLPAGGTLVPEHWTLFMKKLRKHPQFFPIPIKFMMCGEYGETTLRPHYHACIFGIEFPDQKKYSENGQGDCITTSALLDKIWSHGECKIGTLTYDSAAYTARYITKRSGKLFPLGHYTKVDQETGEVITVHPEFARMSNRPGLGKAWFEKYGNDVFPDDFVVIQGRRQKPPRYYDKLLQRQSPQLLAEIKQTRLENSAEASADHTTARLRVREKVKLSKISVLKRNL